MMKKMVQLGISWFILTGSNSSLGDFSTLLVYLIGDGLLLFYGQYPSDGLMSEFLEIPVTGPHLYPMS